MIKVRIDKAEENDWYKLQIGAELFVVQHQAKENMWRGIELGAILKSDCTVIQEEEPVLGDIKELQELNNPTRFDLDKWQTGKFNVQTRDGRKVEIFKTAAKGESPIIGAVINFKDEEYPCSWSQSGRFMNASEAPHDLFLIPKTKTKYINYFESNAFSSIEDALDAIKGNKGALYHLTFTGCKEVIRNE